ncbi:inorganic phosphate transporter, PiT family [Halopenitus malekzadehii]|uniref:Phosphate transporter n=1 Tax=Halopenitus malekzadehii TaxID=1267564 RepID=A0A1H6JQX6_9EURY|nr:inorganic phosphate transporter [Halopenitus malekzadehii]SEH62272.1 inorganic phosphate transporter, PiT family [Halopenitus malekzadehii]
MSESLLLLVGIVVAAFVGINIGGSGTGVAFGPAVGSDLISKVGAGALMSVFVLGGGWTIGRRVVDTLGAGLLRGNPFTLETSIVVLLFVGGALFVSNLFGVPASTSMTAVGAIAGLGVARGTLNQGVALEIVAWWLVAPVVGFWVSAVVGRYWYERLAATLSIDRTGGFPARIDRSGRVPTVRTAPSATTRELIGAVVVLAIACLNAFSAGASNVANAVAPLVGSGDLSMNAGVLLAALAMGAGAFTLGRRTLETMGNDLTELPLTAALVVSLVTSALVVGLSALGIPASFVVIATMSIVGLGWGRATRLQERPDDPSTHSTESGTPETESDATEEVAVDATVDVTEDSTVDVNAAPADALSIADLYKPTTTARVVLLQNAVPVAATIGSYVVFRAVPAL